jgi:hypothetical protein
MYRIHRNERGARNIRPCCQYCNTIRATCGHCVGALACVLDVARNEAVPPKRILRRWRMGLLARSIAAPLPAWRRRSA